MQCYEFETMRRWLTARLRARGVPIDTDDPAVAEALGEAGLGSISAVIRLDDDALDAIARRMGFETALAA